MSKVSQINNIFSHLNNIKPFRLSKNGIPTNIFTKVGEEQEIRTDIEISNSGMFNHNNSIKIKIKKGKKAKKEETIQIQLTKSQNKEILYKMKK